MDENRRSQKKARLGRHSDDYTFRQSHNSWLSSLFGLGKYKSLQSGVHTSQVVNTFSFVCILILDSVTLVHWVVRHRPSALIP